MIDSTQTDSLSAVAEAPADLPAETQAVTEAPQVAQAPVAEVTHGRFDEQIALMPDSIAEPIKDQLGYLPESTVFQIVETHGGGASILYKEYKQAKEANDIRTAKENEGGTKAVPIAKAKLGAEYYTGKGDETATFTVGKLIEFQATGLIVVMLVIIGLCILSYLMSYVVAKLGIGAEKKAEPAKPAAAPAPAPAPLPPASCSLDPDAPSVHPGFTNKQLQAFLSMAAVAALEIHPGLTNDQLAVIFAIAAAEVLGEPCKVVQFRPQNASSWAWVAQGRAELHSNGLK